MNLDRILIALLVVVLVVAASVALLKLSEARKLAPPRADELGTVELLVVGIEGLDISVVDRLSAQGRMPNLSRLMSDGATFEFTNLGKEIAAPVPWASLVTGMSPERRGIGATMTSVRGGTIPVPLAPGQRYAGAIWTVLATSGGTVGVLGWPGTWPVEEVDGVMVGPYAQYVMERKHGGDLTRGVFPVSLLDRVDGMFESEDAKTRMMLSRFVDMETRMGLEALIGQNYQVLSASAVSDESMLRVARSVMADPGVDNLLVFLGGLNGVCQRFWHYMDPSLIGPGELDGEQRRQFYGQVETLGPTVERYYEHLDEALGSLLELLDENGTCAVLSDHGYAGLGVDERGKLEIGYDMHSEKGLCVLRGPRVASGVRLPDSRIFDVAPTVLAAVGLATPEEIDGDVVASAIVR